MEMRRLLMLVTRIQARRPALRTDSNPNSSSRAMFLADRRLLGSFLRRQTVPRRLMRLEDMALVMVIRALEVRVTGAAFHRRVTLLQAQARTRTLRRPETTVCQRTPQLQLHPGARATSMLTQGSGPELLTMS